MVWFPRRTIISDGLSQSLEGRDVSKRKECALVLKSWVPTPTSSVMHVVKSIVSIGI